MDTKELFMSCRRGDIARVQYLVEQKDIELNIKDKWDSSPLYYACLCGHEDLVKYLLQMGASCEVNTFEGERCMYGALSNQIRNMLKNYKQLTSSTMRRNIYTEFLRKLVERGAYSDLTFSVHGHYFQVHKCILAARSKYFAQLLLTKWQGKDVVHLTHKLIVPQAFKGLLDWIYTGQLKVHIDDVEDIMRLAKQCHFDSLLEDLDEKIKTAASYELEKPGMLVTVLSVENALELKELNEDFALLANLALPSGFCYTEIQEFPFKPEVVHIYPDITFVVEQHYFHCHKAFFMCRSDFFKALENDHFNEHSTSQCIDCELTALNLNGVTSAVFAQVINYLYSDTCELKESNVYEILYIGDMYLLPGLKRQCAGVISKYLNMSNVVTALQTARLFNLPNLENNCAAFMSKHIEMMLADKEFAALVTEDASTVKQRQETDSIPIIDDIRFHLTNSVQDFSDIYETEKKIQMIDEFLESLHLEA